MIHDKLERFNGKEVDKVKAKEALDNFYYIHMLVNGDYMDISDSFVKMLSYKTIRIELIELLQKIKLKSSIDYYPPVYNESWQKLYEYIQRSRAIQYKECSSDLSQCPHDFMELPDSVRMDLERYRLVLCPNCGKFIIRTLL
jgi:hypothetical protein